MAPYIRNRINNSKIVSIDIVVLLSGWRFSFVLFLQT